MDSNTSTHCRELERLAAAAATMDYSESVSLEQCPPTQEILRSNLQPSTAVMPSSFCGTPSQIISYIDPYHISRGHSQIVDIRSLDGHSYTAESLQSLQQVSNSRIVMMTTNTAVNSNLQISGWPITHLAMNGMVHYPSSTLENDEDETFTGSQEDLQRHPAVDSHTAPGATSIAKNALHINDDKQEVIQENEFTIISPSEVASTTSSVSKADDTSGNVGGQNPSDVTENTFKCSDCKDSFSSEMDLQTHLEVHKLPKRSGLSLETKIEIIKRIAAGEKKADMAEEYKVNRSTIKSVMEKSETYLLCWKKGLFNPESKRLKGPKREDVEEALHSWYKQSLRNGTPVSGPILCNKAVDFAKKLGHSDFKPTHGWLDRFKKRKKIVFGRGSLKRTKEKDAIDDSKLQEWQNTVIPQILFDYSASDIFGVEEIGLFFDASPCDVSTMRNQKCSGGVRASERLSLILCSNMTGNEKFPLLVIGKNTKILEEHSQKSLPVHYLYDPKAWITSDSFNAWLLDMDSWLVQQNRKICLLCCSSPIHANIPSLVSIKIYKTPLFLSPLRHMALGLFKKEYRKLFLEELILNISKSQKADRLIPQTPLLKCLILLSSTWHSIHETSIITSFQRAGITKFPVWHSTNTAESVLPINGQAILDKLTACGYSPKLLLEDYSFFDNNMQVCHLMRDEDIIAEVKGECEKLEESNDTNSVEENSISPSLSQVGEALGILRRYIQYQEGAQEMYRVLGHLEFLLQKGFPEKPYALHPS